MNIFRVSRPNVRLTDLEDKEQERRLKEEEMAKMRKKREKGVLNFAEEQEAFAAAKKVLDERQNEAKEIALEQRKAVEPAKAGDIKEGEFPFFGKNFLPPKILQVKILITHLIELKIFYFF